MKSSPREFVDKKEKVTILANGFGLLLKREMEDNANVYVGVNADKT